MALEFWSQTFKNSTAAVYSTDKLLIGEVNTNTNESGTCPFYLILGTIHLRRWQIFTIFDPYPPTMGIPAKCL